VEAATDPQGLSILGAKEKCNRRDAELAEADAEKTMNSAALGRKFHDNLTNVFLFFSASVSASSASRRLPLVFFEN
jgi:hypothetical protein